MKIPPVQPVSFSKALDLFNRKPRTLLENDPVLYLHCHETAARMEDPLLASNAFTLAHHTLLVECSSRGVVPLPAHQSVIDDVVREMIELGTSWEDELEKRLRSDHRNFHAVFDGWAKKKPRPALVRQNALRSFRIFELLLQPL